MNYEVKYVTLTHDRHDIAEAVQDSQGSAAATSDIYIPNIKWFNVLNDALMALNTTGECGETTSSFVSIFVGKIRKKYLYICTDFKVCSLRNNGETFWLAMDRHLLLQRNDFVHLVFVVMVYFAYF